MKNLPKDKLYHFVAGVVISLIGGFVLSPIEGIGLAIAGGIFKECYDRYDYGKYDIADMIATWIGGACGFAVVSLIQYWR